MASPVMHYGMVVIRDTKIVKDPMALLFEDLMVSYQINRKIHCMCLYNLTDLTVSVLKSLQPLTCIGITQGHPREKKNRKKA